jgi:predicted metalloprotease with PDZ domain
MYMSARPLSRTLALLVLAVVVPLHARTDQTTIALSIDAREAPRRLLHSRETIAVRPGPLTLLYPKWIPGEHGPTGPITDIAGLRITAGGKAILWRRDLVEMYAIHCTVPEGSASVEVFFDYLLHPIAEGFSAGASSTAHLLVLSWNSVVMYPRDVRPDDISVVATLQLPDEWKYGGSLETNHTGGGTTVFKQVTLTTLIDSPVLCGKYFRRIDISAEPSVPHAINLASDGDAPLDMSPALIDSYKRLVLETNALFGAHHYDHYDFLYTLSDQVAHFGLEHHQSSDNRLAERSLVDADMRKTGAGLLPHEFVHSWNGKYRRPAGLATGDYSTPMKNDLLWVYEGLTQYLGNILTARSGLRTPEEYVQELALTAAGLDNRPGREWRPLQDAADEAEILYSARRDWDAYRRGVDFYAEGDLVWLETDVIIRAQTHGKKSLDDFCKLFYGGANSGPQVKPYTFDDVVETLAQVAPYDWRTFLTDRLQSVSAHAPLHGITNGGWRLVYRDTMSAMQISIEEVNKILDMRFSLGIEVAEDGRLNDVIPGMPAAQAGLAPVMKLVAVNGRKYTKEVLRDAVRGARNIPAPIDLLVSNGDYFTTFAVNYHGGERSPFLERDGTKPDLLSEIIKPVRAK